MLTGENWKSSGTLIKKAWMTGTIFEDWLIQFNAKMKRQNRKILILLDYATCHKIQTELSNVSLLFLPANTTSRLQPLDQGIIQSFKSYYRKKVLSHLIGLMDTGKSFKDLNKSITMLDVIDWTTAAWKEVKVTTIEKCFAMCGAVTTDTQRQDAREIDMVTDIEG